MQLQNGEECDAEETDFKSGSPMMTVRKKGKKTVRKYVESLPKVSKPLS
jgi:hypothetical protein